MDTGIIYNIYEQKKIQEFPTRNFVSDASSFNVAKSQTLPEWISIGFPIVIQSSKNVCFPTLNELASLTNFRVGDSCIFFCSEML